MMIVLFSADNVSLYDELANSIEEQEEDPFPLPLPELGGHTESAKIHLKLNYVTLSKDIFLTKYILHFDKVISNIFAVPAVITFFF